MVGRIALAGVIGLVAVAARGAPAALLTLTLPRQPAAQEKVWLSVTTGPLPHGAAIRVDAPDGSVIELLTTFGGHAGTGGASAIVPLPQRLIAGGRVQLRLTVVGAGPDHSPAQAEVKDAHLIFVPTTPP